MNFATYLIQQFPKLQNSTKLESQLKVLISPNHLKVPKQVLTRIEQSVKSIVSYAHTATHLESVKSTATAHERKILEAPAPQKSALGAFDFHYNETSDQLSLIEINTNASAFLVAANLYSFKNIQPLCADPVGLLFQSFKSEVELFGLADGFKTFIIDEDLESQRMYFEFLMYQDFFSKRGWPAEVCDYSRVSPQEAGALVYNRYCDFLFERPGSAHLLKQFLDGQNLFTPSPKEYLLLAAKDRLADFAEKQISEAVIPSKKFTEFSDPDEIWRARKDFYFKPRRMYGGKAVFRGASISRKRFDELDASEYLVQENRPPGTLGDWKFDLRAYTYGEEIQLIIARLFQGQLLNFSTEGSGLATVEFSDVGQIAVEKS